MPDPFFNAADFDGAIGLGLHPGATITAVLGALSGFGSITVEMDLGPPDSDPIILLRADPTEEERVVAELNANPMVLRAGPAVRITDRSISFLTNQLIIQFDQIAVSAI